MCLSGDSGSASIARRAISLCVRESHAWAGVGAAHNKIAANTIARIRSLRDMTKLVPRITWYDRSHEMRDGAPAAALHYSDLAADRFAAVTAPRHSPQCARP